MSNARPNKTQAGVLMVAAVIALAAIIYIAMYRMQGDAVGASNEHADESDRADRVAETDALTDALGSSHAEEGVSAVTVSPPRAAGDAASLAPQALPEATWEPRAGAVSALQNAMRHGESRTPPLAESAQREGPSEQELSDPALYLEYEARQKEQVYESFLKASNEKVTELEALIAEGEREGGVTEEQLDEGRRKLEALKLRRDEVLSAHPDAASDDEANAGAE